MNSPEQLTLEALLAEADWVRGLARALVDCPELADDVVQDVWVAALERRSPPGQSLRGWLVQVVRNSVRKTWRTEGRRREREELVARTEEVSSTLDVVERFSTQQAVGAAVLGLEEPYRETVLLRYYEELGLREIAERTGVAVSTVDWRLRRALGDLHKALDEHAGGDRRKSMLALAGLSGQRTTTACSTSAVVTLAAWAGGWRVVLLGAGGLLAAVSVGVFLFRPAPPSRLPSTSSSAVTKVASTPGRLALPPAAYGDGGPRMPVADGAVPPSNISMVRVASLDVIVLAAGGLGAANIPIRLTPELSTSAVPAPRVRRTGPDGRVCFDALSAGMARVETPFDVARQVDLEAGGRVQLELELPPGPALSGTVEDERGDPVAGALLWLSSEGAQSWVGGSAVSSFVDDVPVAVSDAQGRFALPTIGRARMVGAYARGYAPSLPHDLVQHSGRSPAIRIVLPDSGAAVTGRVLDDRDRPLDGALVFIDAVAGREERAGDLSAPLLRTRSDSDGRFEFVSVRSGRHRVVATSPGLTPRKAMVDVPDKGACQIDLMLTPGARIVGSVHTEDGKPVANALVYAARRRWRTLPDTRYCTATRTDSRGDYDLAGIRPGAVWITVEGGELGRHQELLGERVEDRAEVYIQLSRGLEIRGRVVDDGGQALAGSSVHVAPEGQWRARSRSTDKAGRFSLSNCEDVPHRLQVVEHGFVVAQRSLMPGKTEVTIVVMEQDRPSAQLRGTLVDSDGEPVDVRGLHLTPAEGGRHVAVSVQAPGGGAFRSAPILPGTYVVTVLTDGHDSLVLEGTVRLVRGGAQDLGLLELPPASRPLPEPSSAPDAAAPKPRSTIQHSRTGSQ